MKIQQTFSINIFLIFFLSTQLTGSIPFPYHLVEHEAHFSKQQITDDPKCPPTKKYCVGILRFRDGSVYNGEISYGKPNGKGFMKWPDGSYYIGAFAKGERSGEGEFHFRNGNRYEGNWENNEMDGYGIYIWSNGTEFIGHFRSGEMHGTGSVVLSNGESYFGDWQNNLPNGEGSFTLNNGSQYSGSVRNGLRDGEGFIAWENGDTILGNWSVGRFEGEVNFKYNNGDQLLTEWEDGQLASNSSYQSKEGRYIEGNLHEIKEILLFEDLDNAFASNIQFTLYSIGLEYGNLNQFEKASEYLYMAYSIDSGESQLSEEIGQSLYQIKEKRKSGWAKLNQTND